MIVNEKNYLKNLYLEQYDKLEKLRKNVPYFYNYVNKISEEDENLSNKQLNTELLSEKDEQFLLYKLVYMKTGVFYMLLLEEEVFNKFLEDIEVLKEINKTINDIDDNPENEVELDNYYSGTDIKNLRNEYKDLFLMTYSEDNKNNKRISYKTKIDKLNRNIKHISKIREEFINKIKTGNLTYEEYKKIIKSEAKIIIKLNPSLKYFRLLLDILKRKDKHSPDFINKKWINTIQWGIDKEKEIIDILVMYNIRLVIKYVKFYQSIVPNNLNFNDIKHEGILGLIHAIYKFDPFKKWKLSTYATWWIKQHIISTINENRSPIKIPLYYSKIISEYEKIKKEYQNKGKNLSDAEIAKIMGISERKLKASKNFVLKNNLSINDARTEEEDFSLEDIIASEIYDENNNILNKLEKEEILKFIKKFVEEENILNEKEKFIIKNRLEIFTSKPETLQSIAFKMKLTKERIRQLENLALQKIINAIKEYFNIVEEYNELNLLDEEEEKTENKGLNDE